MEDQTEQRRLETSGAPACAARDSTLQSLEMNGSHPLDDASIDDVLTQTLPGNSALGCLGGDTFKIFYVGARIFDLRHRLHECAG